MKKILVIQEEGNCHIDFEEILPNDSFELFYSHKLKDGLEISVRYSPDLIILCLNNNLKYLDIIEKIIDEEKTSSIPIITVSENNTFNHFRKIMELGADDYIPIESLNDSLLKSVNKRLAKLEKLKLTINNQINSFEEDSHLPQRDDHILVKIGNKLKLIKFNEIVCITALKEYSKLTTIDNCKIVMRKSLKNWIEILPLKTFLRIHRGTIINLDHVEKIVKTNERTYTVHLKFISETFDFSQRYANIMRQTFPS